MTSKPSLLLTGATGFVGGTVLSQLSNASHKVLNSVSLTAVVRKQSQADILREQGIDAVVLPGGLANLASQNDIVINSATGFHTGAAEALITGLGKRKGSGEPPIYIHLSGTTSLSVGDVTGNCRKCLTFSHKDEGIYEYYDVAHVRVFETGEKLGLRTYILMPPLIYGRGTGFFNDSSQQIPMLVRNAIKAGRAEYIRPGASKFGHVHIADLAEQFEAVLLRALAHPQLPAGRNCYLFSNTGSHTWLEVASAIGKTGYELGALKSAEASPTDIADAAAKLWEGVKEYVELIFASSTLAERSYEVS